MFSVLIRPLAVTDAFLSWKWRNDLEVWKYTGTKPNQKITYEVEKEWIEKVLVDNTSRRFAILVDDEYVGNIQLTNIEENKTAEYHIFIGNKNYWGKGIASLATYQIIRYAKTVLKLEEIYLTVNSHNIPAIKVYEKCNFIRLNNDIKMSFNLLEKIIPKVSIFMMVYNHEKYIEDALTGILMQKCNFDFEIIVGEDFSIDESRDIILKYENEFPGKFKLLLHPSNIGAQKNQLAVLENCCGNFVAMCEGDDYWTDPLKLQKQVDFLEANPEYSICWTKYSVKNESDTLLSLQEPDWVLQLDTKNDITIDLNSIFTPYCTYTLTSLFRRESFDISLLKSLQHSKDNSLYAICLSKGKGMLMNFCSSVYRMHQGGVYSSASVFNQKYFSYLNLKEIVEEVPNCNNDNIRGIRNYLLSESIKLYPNHFSFGYSKLIIDSFKFLGIKKGLIIVIKNIINRNRGK
jgi:RimJ/RimL family protein N-acetyltransferase/glycosyltransferase involved in cell wall biosynthesis